MKIHLVALTILSISFFASCKKTDSITETLPIALSADSTVSKTISGQFVPGELLVKFKAGTGEKSRTQTLSFINGKVAEHILTPAMESAGDNQGIYLINTTTDIFSAIARMKGESNIEYAEPNWIYHHTQTTTATDYYFVTNGQLWGMYSETSPSDYNDPLNRFGSQANRSWANNHKGSKDVFIGIIDEGYMYTHEDLAANAEKNPGEIEGDGIDNDNNGYKDDVYGWDFANNNSSVFDGTDDDHGTHVAGTIGASGNNNGKVVGVCWNVSLLNAKFLGRNGGTTANAIKAVDYFTDLKTRHGLNIVATNNSWGGGGFSQGLYDAIENANQAGILFIAAAGNSTKDIDASPSFPAAYTNENIIAVASIEPTNGTLSYFSNWGGTSVDLAAPGSGIYSTVPGGNKAKAVSSYAKYSGTSMATPHVTGAAALYAATNLLTPKSAIDAAVIKKAILDAVTKNSALTTKCVSGGHLNVSGF